MRRRNIGSVMGQHLGFRQRFWGWAQVTITTGTPAIDDSHNVSSLTDNAAGDITVTWRAAARSANAPVALLSDATATAATRAFHTLHAQVAGSARCAFFNYSAAALFDPARFYIAILDTY